MILLLSTSCFAREFSEKSDMWSLGMVLYAMCFTSLPFSHDDPHAPWVSTASCWDLTQKFINFTTSWLHELNHMFIRPFLVFFSLCRFQPPQLNETTGAEGFDQVLRRRKTLHLRGDRHASWRGVNYGMWRWVTVDSMEGVWDEKMFTNVFDV